MKPNREEFDMIFAATKAIDAAIKAQNWSCDIDEQEKSSAVITGFNMKSGSSMQIFFISAADNDLAIRAFQFIPIPAGKMDIAIKTCNAINRQFRFTKFVANDNGFVGIEMDVAVETANIDKVAVELLMRLLNIADEAYPTFKQAFDGPAVQSPRIISPNGNGAGRY